MNDRGLAVVKPGDCLTQVTENHQQLLLCVSTHGGFVNQLVDEGLCGVVGGCLCAFSGRCGVMLGVMVSITVV